MHLLGLICRFGAPPVPPAAPTLTLTSGSSDNTPDFILTGDLAELDTVRFQYSTDSGFSGASEVTNTIDAAEDATNELDFSTGGLANGTWYFRARVERPSSGNSDWSNTETITIFVSDAAGPISLFGRWLGGFGAPSPVGPANGGPISLFGRWLGGFGSAPEVVTPPVEEAPSGAGGVIVAGHFSRGKWRALRDEINAKRRKLELAALEEQSARKRAALDKAAKAAAVINAAEDENQAIASKLEAMNRALDAAAGALKVRTAIEEANRVVALARQIAKQLADEEEEEEAMILLLTNG